MSSSSYSVPLTSSDPSVNKSEPITPANEDDQWPTPPDLQISTRGKLLRVLTLAQHGSGVLFSSFLLVHLIPPAIVALTGDEHSGSAFMLLGKVYYQGALEPLLIYGSLAVHAVTSLLRRVVYPRSVPSVRKSSHSLTGYLALPLVALHLQLHRWIPSIKAPPISSLSPSEMDLTFVGDLMQRRPLSASLYYVTLTGLVLYHGLSGFLVIGRRWGLLSPEFSKNARAKRQAGLLGSTIGVVGLVGLGLIRLARDSHVPAQLARRFEEVHRRALPSALL